jgi:TolA-binding protein
MHSYPQKLLCALAFAIAIVPSQVGADAIDDQYAVAAGHYDRGRWDLAIESFRGFLNEHADHARASQARFFLAESLVQTRQFAEAAQQFRDFLAKQPDPRYARKALFRAGESSYFAGQWEAADSDLRKFQSQDSKDKLNAYVLAYLGDVALRKKDAPDAEKWFNEGLKKFPLGPLQDDCRYGLARALDLQQNHEEARRLYVALAAKQNSPLADDAQFRLGASQFATHDYDVADKTWAALEATFPTSDWIDRARLGRGQALYYLEKYEPATVLFRSLVSHPPVAIQAQYWIGLTQKAQHDWTAAAATLLAAAEADANKTMTPALRFHAGEALLQAGKLSEAKAQFDLVLEGAPEGEFADDSLLGKIQSALAAGQNAEFDQLAADFAARFADSPLRPSLERVKAQAYLGRKQFPQAIEVLEAVLAAAKSQPTDPARSDLQDRNSLAAAYLGAGRCEDALKMLAPVLAESQGELKAEAQWTQALALVELARYRDAIPPLEALLKTELSADASAQAQGQLAVCYARTKQLDRARQTYTALVAKNPQHQVLPATTKHLAEMALAEGNRAWSAELFASLAESKAAEFAPSGLSGLAWSQFQADKLTEAAATFERLLTRFPQDPLAAEAALTRGQILEQLKQPDAALVMYQRVIEGYGQSKQLPHALWRAAHLHSELQQAAEAAALYERLVKEFPKFPELDAVLYELAWERRELKQDDAADALFERLRTEFRTSRFWPDALFRLAERATQAKEYARATVLLSELVAGKPDSKILAHALFSLAQVKIAQEQWAESVPPLEQLIKEAPESPLRLLAEYWIAEAGYRRGEFDASGEKFALLAQQTKGRNDPWLAMVPLRRAQVLAHQKKWPEARLMALAIAQDYPAFEQQYEADYVVGRSFASQGMFQEARDAYRKVIQSSSGGKTETAAMAQWMIGESLFHQKNYEAALREYLRVEILYAYPTWQSAALLQAAKCHESLGEWKQASDLYARLIKTYPNSNFTEEATNRLQVARQKVDAR